ncbi:TRAP transporter substrate-binding protein [Pararhizobium haloflavum]|uniref:TRAP transporter substrate-binding protein n=1 Tax=Pararhizobium haloflavum TaxID=2037914 RepID=UPI000C17E1F0|nr:TRAP transporter substrate-binding protein [Pararhizobium haloflavum]
MLNRLTRGLTAATLIAGLATASASAEELRYAHVGAEGDIQTRYAAEVAEEVAAATDGALTIQVFPASQLGGVAEMVDGVRMGSISMGHHDFASLERIVPEIAVFNAPFIYRDGAHAVAATDPETSPALQELNEQLVAEGGVRIIGRIYRGARHISSNFEVKSPEDLAGKPFRAVPLDLWISMVTGFGATPTPVEVAELPTALMTGLVVGQENPLTMITSNKLYEVQSHVAMTGHMQSVLAVFVNEDAWQALDEETRNTVTEILDAKADESLQWATDSEAELVKEVEDAGMTVITEEDGLDIEAFREAVLAQINEDFPAYTTYIEQIAAVE